MVTVGSPLPQLGDLITLLYLFAIARSSLPFPVWIPVPQFTAIGASREAMLGVLVVRCCCRLWVAAQVAGSTNISNITDLPFISWPPSQSIPLVLALCACGFATFIELGKLPFDLAEARAGAAGGPAL
ncbi:NADH-quinone oxidoreductase subunit H [Escherichia coli]